MKSGESDNFDPQTYLAKEWDKICVVFCKCMHIYIAKQNFSVQILTHTL